ncbi:NADH-ubiquinone oxidoreductase 21 kDa subunit, mitochondrial [Fusarium euwallaceae]|uniref:NADH dehydrogenase [ubiquinone] iron-sulfur protein 4, mitochondrial n=4 Tax=Fusarium solani species complex TaxID=232080 RepID=A0A3M2RYG4_9HYPO|nr:NADH-ubiquinone oxidoreductase 21 kDa subunit, mitochondrial [Fusarium kuroshium]RSL49099.1 NADH-ubiquinone oxidoreductase 21 kDa subunit, mitochondrial [Fusarium floridanum]RSL93775.1 NADH-ubiquinone oxidoreductase 21 kDa subunit, mitochondrial [Fusarium oligoseptatum]RTE74183.1 NADH-ubiquinone oxidoreductase 21 kDa subunit, mitochondrial [Fusarium euwallaceae]
MASLRSQRAAQLLRGAIAPRVALSAAPRRFQSSVTQASGTVPAPTTNEPDYDIQADKATSTYTPVPKSLQEGTEEILPAATISGAPMELQARTVRIYQETKPATQSGEWRGQRWRMDWDILSKGHRWENPLMGWQSSGDFMQGTHINFKSKEDAIHFAEKQGYEYFVQEPNSRKFTPKAYANNFLYSAGKLKHVRTK